MACDQNIHYPGGTVRNDLYAAAANQTDALENVKTTLLAAGWTLSSTITAWNLLTFVLNPVNNFAIRFGITQGTNVGELSYTFKTVINNANEKEVLIGATLSDTIDNLKAAMNLSAGSGTLYSSATTAHPIFAASTKTATTLKVVAKVAGPAYNNYLIENSGGGDPGYSGDTFGGFGRTGFGGYKLLSAKTPQQQQMLLYLFWNAQGGGVMFDRIRFHVSTPEDDLTPFTTIVDSTSPGNNDDNVGARVDGNNGTQLRIIANKYQAFVLQNNSAGSTANAFVGFGVPWVPDFQAAKAITAATNATPIAVTTSAAHGYTTGYLVTIRGVGGNTATNVTANAITVTSPTTFTIDGSVGNGVYTSGGRVARDDKEILNAFWVSSSGTGIFSFRNRSYLRTNSAYAVLLNLSAHLSTGGTTGSPQIVIPAPSATDDAQNELLWFNGAVEVAEPLIGWGLAAGGTFFLIGSLWGVGMMMKAKTRDTSGTFDSHNWWNLTDNCTGDAGTAETSMLVEVP